MSNNNPIQMKVRVHYTPALGLDICTAIAEGKTMVEIGATEGMPSRQTIYQWLSVYPKFFDAFTRAKEVSAMSFEEEALTMARNLAGQNDFTGTRVQAYNIAMQQLRWSASRRDKSTYGQQIQTQVTVPIQINTTLNLDPNVVALDNRQSIYTVEAVVNVGGPDEPTEEERIGDDSSPDDTAPFLDLTPERPTSRNPFDLPDEESQQFYNPPTGRPPGSKDKRKRAVRSDAPPPKPKPRSVHKSPGMAAKTALRYAEAERKRLAKATQPPEE